MDVTRTCYLFFDYDGTVAIKGRIPKENREALLRMHRMGHKLILCTGRSWAYLQTSTAYRSIPWDAILLGGSDVYWRGRFLRRRSIKPREVMLLATYAIAHRVTLMIEGTRGVYTYRFGRLPRQLFPYEVRRILDRIREVLQRDRATKVSLYPCHNDVPSTTADFLLHKSLFGEFARHGCTKASLIRFLCRRKHIPRSRCIAFGDSLNDLSMFELLPESVAMQHAPEELVRAATYHAKGSYGVAEGIEHFFGPKQY